MKVWEETWDESDGVVSIAQKNERDFFLAKKALPDRFPWEQSANVGAFGDLSGAGPFNPLPEDVERAQLAAAAPEMARALRLVIDLAHDEYSDLGESLGRDGRYAIVAALEKAGVDLPPLIGDWRPR